MSKIKINNTTYYYELHGSGQPIVLVSGYTGDHSLWISIIDNLIKNYQVLIFDNRAVGQTQDDGSSLSAELMADETILLTRALGLKNPHFVGSSMGGTIVQCMGSKYADEIGKLVLLCTSAKWRPSMVIALSNLIKLKENDVDDKLIYENLMAWVFGEKFLSNPENVELFIKSKIINQEYAQSLTDQKRQLEVLPKFDGRGLLKLIKSPTLVIGGTEDLLSINQESEYLYENISNSKLVFLEGAHALMFENPENLVKVIKEFIN